MNIINKIKNCDTMPKLDGLRIEVVNEMQSNDGKDFQAIQQAFIKQKNKLQRIPLRDRKW